MLHEQHLYGNLELSAIMAKKELIHVNSVKIIVHLAAAQAPEPAAVLGGAHKLF